VTDGWPVIEFKSINALISGVILFQKLQESLFDRSKLDLCPVYPYVDRFVVPPKENSKVTKSGNIGT
jgi:hypothetical protein